MSIYAVRITEWYDRKDSSFYKERDLLKGIMKFIKCHRCKNKMATKWKTGYVMHSITFGGPDEAWCTKRCYLGVKK